MNALSRRAATVPDWAWLALLLLVVLLPTIAYVLEFATYLIMQDELAYMKQAVHIADTGTLSGPGEQWYFNSYAQLPSVLWALAYGTLDDTTQAYDVAHVLGAIAFISAGIPAFLIARAVTASRWASLLAAVLVVVVPWLSTAATLMTEAPAYPLALWALWAGHRALVRRSPRADVLAVAFVVLATLGRSQLVVMAGTLMAGVLLHEALWERGGLRGLRSAVRAHVVLIALSVAGLLALVIAPLRQKVIGAYDVTDSARSNLLPPGYPDFAHEITAYVITGAGAITVALGVAWLLLTFARPASRVAHAFACLAVPTGIAHALLSSWFNFGYTNGINDRYMVYLAPILILAGVAMLADRRAALVPLLVGGGAVGLFLATADLEGRGLVPNSPAQVFHTVLDGRASQVRDVLGASWLSTPVQIGVGVFAACLLFALARRRFAGPATAVVVAVIVLLAGAQTAYTMDRLRDTQAGVPQSFLDQRAWLDAETPGDEPIGLVLGEAGDGSPATWWDLSFWSKRADRVWRPRGGPEYDQRMIEEFDIDAETGRVTELSERSLLVVADQERRFAFRGAQRVAARNGFTVLRVPAPVHVAWLLGTPDTVVGDMRLGRPIVLRLYAPDRRPGRHELVLTAQPMPLAQRPFELSAGDERVRVPLGANRSLRTFVEVGERGYADVRLRVRDPGSGPTPDPDSGLRLVGVDFHRAHGQ